MAHLQSVDRAFAILEALAAGPLGVSELARRVGLPKSTTARFLAALQDQHAVEQLANGSYHVGPRIRHLARGQQPAQRLVEIARPFLAGLAAATGAVGNLIIPDGDHTLVIDQVGPGLGEAVPDWTGSRIPMLETSGGQVLLTSFSAAELADYLATPPQPSTLATITDASALRRRLRSIVEARYGWVVGEAHQDLSSVSAGVADESGRFACCLSLHGPSAVFPPPGQKGPIGRLVADAAARMSLVLRGKA
jgi:IclR family acetate operon transcriptional repressor